MAKFSHETRRAIVFAYPSQLLLLARSAQRILRNSNLKASCHLIQRASPSQSFARFPFFPLPSAYLCAIRRNIETPAATFTGAIVKRTRPHTYKAIIEASARDCSVNSIANQHRVSRNTVDAIQRNERQAIEHRKKTLAVMFEDLCESSIKRAKRKVGTASYAQACVGAGIAAQRMMELRGEHRQDTGLTVNLLQFIASDI